MLKAIKSLFIITFFLGIVSCSTDKYPGFKEGDNNVFYKVHYTTDDTSRPHFHKWVTLNMDYRLEDTILFSSKNLDKPLRFSMIDPMFRGDLYDGLSMMTVGDSMTFAIVADSFFVKTTNFKQLPDFVLPGSPMYYDVKLLEVMTDDEYNEKLDLEKIRYKREEILKLESYLSENNIETEPLKSGLYYLPIKTGAGKKPDTGDMCRIFLEVKEIDGNLLFNNFDGTPIDVEYGKNFDTKGFMEGLGLTRVGGSATLIVPSPIGVGERGKDLVKPFTTIIYKVELIEIKSVEEVQQERADRKKAKEAEKQRLKDLEKQNLKNYLSRNNIIAEPTKSGLYFIETIKGSGEKPVKGETVNVHYVLYDTDGQEIQNSYTSASPASFKLGEGRVIMAWEEAVLKMNRGGKAKIIVPSKLAYGSRGRDNIGPYEPLVFELELLGN